MATVLNRVPVDRITAEARDVQFARTALTVLAAVLYGVGWMAGKVFSVMWLVFSVMWLVVAWSVTAVKVGWQEARRPGGG